MNLPEATRETIGWTGRVIAALIRVCPGRTLTLIAALALGRTARLLAFFLPLKVLILAGAERVPRYFPFIDPELTGHWIVGLSIGSLIAYAATVALDRWVDQMAEQGGRQVAAHATALTVLARQEERARAYYGDFGGIAGDGLVVILAAVALALLQPVLMLALLLAVGVQFAGASRVLASRGHGLSARAREALLTNPASFIEAAYAVTFFFGFLVLLAGFLLADAAAFLATILSFLILRQLLGSLSAALRTVIRLRPKRYRIDPIVFPEQRWRDRERPSRRNLREHFNKTQRQAQASAALSRAMGAHPPLDVRWQDPPPRAPYQTLLIVAGDDTAGFADGTGPCRYWQQQIFTASARQGLDDEAMLFGHIDRSRLRAPEILVADEHGGFLYRICDAGLGRPPNRDEWAVWAPILTRERWALAPPTELIAAYQSARHTLPERLGTELLTRLELAVDSARERHTYDRLQALLPGLRRRLEQLPLYICHPTLRRRMTLMTENGGPLIPYWGSWRLEPLGGGLQDIDLEPSLLAMLEHLPDLRTDAASPPDADSVRLARWSRLLEERIVRLQYKRALAIATRIVRHFD